MFYELACEKSDELAAKATAFESLAVRWAEAQSARVEDKCNDLIKCNTRCDAAFVNGDGSPFVESDELDELAHIKGSLRVLAGRFKAVHPWLLDVKRREEKTFSLPSNDSSFNNLWILQFVILNNEAAALHDFVYVGEVLHKVADLLERINFSPEAIRSDLLGPRKILRLLMIGSRMVTGGANMARLSVDFVEGNNDRWKEFKEKAEELNLKKGTTLPQVS